MNAPIDYKKFQEKLNAYRKSPKGGAWVGRRFTETRRYKEIRIGLADDLQEADGRTVYSFDQAQKAAREWFETERRKDGEIDDVFEGNYTVAQAMQDYLAHYKIEGKGLSATTTTVNAHILPMLGDIRLDKLTARKITDWQQKLASTPARLRTARAEIKQRTKEETSDAENIRRRRATAILQYPSTCCATRTAAFLR